MSQIHIPTEIHPEDLIRERTFGGALILCAKAAGHDLDKELYMELEVDKGQFSRWKNDQEGVNWKKLRRLMDYCGNHAPVLWMLDQLGYDVTSLRKKESETERQLRESQEQAQALANELDILRRNLTILKK